jgi:hypothetical protein
MKATASVRWFQELRGCSNFVYSKQRIKYIFKLEDGMKTRRSVLRLALGSALCFAYLMPASAQVTSPNGSYGILVNEWKVSNSNIVRGFLSSLNFDGAGNVTGPYVFITVNDTADGGAGIQLLMTGGSLLGQGQVMTGIGRSAQGTMPAGSYGFQLNQWPDAQHEPLGVFGVVNLDGAGNAAGSLTVLGHDAGPTPFSTTFTGTYSVKPDGTGQMILNLDIGVTVTLATVVTDGGSTILMLQVDESDGFGSVVSGTARKQ